MLQEAEIAEQRRAQRRSKEQVPEQIGFARELGRKLAHRVVGRAGHRQHHAQDQRGRSRIGQTQQRPRQRIEQHHRDEQHRLHLGGQFGDALGQLAGAVHLQRGAGQHGCVGQQQRAQHHAQVAKVRRRDRGACGWSCGRNAVHGESPPRAPRSGAGEGARGPAPATPAEALCGPTVADGPDGLLMPVASRFTKWPYTWNYL